MSLAGLGATARRRDVRTILHARDGGTIIEFAMVVTPFFALMLAVLQTSLIYFTQEALETSVESSARSVVTGKAQAADVTGAASGMTQAQLQTRFKNAACATLPAYMSCSKLLVDVRSAQNWNGIDTTVPTITYDANGNPNNQLSYSLGNQGAVVLVRLMYLWPIQAAPMQLGLANAGNGQRLIVATSVAKTESY